MPTSPSFTRTIAVFGFAIVVTAAGALLPGNDSTSTPMAASPSTEVSLIPGGDLTAQVDQLQTHLTAQPNDSRSWAALALTLVEQGRVTVDPTLYEAAADATYRSLQVQPIDNDLALAAKASLASAQHRFTKALALSRQALAVNRYSASALAVRVDALTELGRSRAAVRSARRMDRVQPGLAASTRLAYQAELRGQLERARRLFTDAAVDSTTPEATAFVEYHLGELARQRGELASALRHYRAAESALPEDLNAMAGRAAVYAATGHLSRAITVLQRVVGRTPLPQHVIALGELLELDGDAEGAGEQYAVVEAMIALASTSGVRSDLELAQFEADHGDPSAALRAARQEWQRRQAPSVADAMAWSLYQAGRSGRAIGHAEQAVTLGGDARAWHHLGVIQADLGHDDEAIRSLRTALKLDRSYPAWQHAQLVETLRTTEAAS